MTLQYLYDVSYRAWWKLWSDYDCFGIEPAPEEHCFWQDTVHHLAGLLHIDVRV